MPNHRNISLAWEILFHDKQRLLLSLAGIAFSVLTMFVELGFFNGFNDSQVNLIDRYKDADLVMLHKHKTNMVRMDRMEKSHLYQTLAFDEIAELIPVYEGHMRAKNPDSGLSHRISVIAFPADADPFLLEGFDRYRDLLKRTNTVLFDSRSRTIYGDVRPGMDIELNNRTFQVGGLVTLGPNFANNGYVLMSDTSWRSSRRSRHEISFGLIRLKPGSDAQQVKQQIQSSMPNDILVMTQAELRARDIRVFIFLAPLGIVFGIGLVVGFIIGIIICYQIIFNEITDHLAQYATLKAIGFSNWYMTGVVLQIALLLSLTGFLPGLLGGWIIYRAIDYFSRIRMFLTFGRIGVIYLLTVVMCTIAGLLAARKVIDADPAEVF